MAGPVRDVLVVGAGIAGLAVACALAERGIAADVVDRAPEPQPAGAGITLHANALAALGPLAARIAAAGAAIPQQVITASDGGVTTVDWTRVWPGGTLPVAVHRRVLTELLLAGPAAETTRWSTEPVRFEQARDHVRVRFADGDEQPYRIVIGADGVRSRVRAEVDPEARPEFLGELYWRTALPAEDDFAVRDWRVWRSGRHSFGMMPIGGGLAHVFLQESVDDRTRIPQDEVRARLLDTAESLGGPIRRLVELIGRDELTVVRPALGVQTERWTAGRIALAGDAVHAFSPATTQGGGLAIEDAAVLADEIDRLGPGLSALAAYELRRRPRVARFARMARRHGALTRLAPVHDGKADGPGPRDGSAWFRLLYEPLTSPL